MILIWIRKLILFGVFFYLFYQTLFDHYIIWSIGLLTWLLPPSKQNNAVMQTHQYPPALRAKIMQNDPSTNALLLTALQNLQKKQNPIVEEAPNSKDLSKGNEYLVELNQIRQFGVRNPKLKELLDAEIHFCSKKMNFSTLRMTRQQILEQLLKVQELLRTTSRQVFREQLLNELTALQDKLDSVSTELMKAELSQDEVKKNLVQCRETIDSVIDKLSEEEAPTSSSDESGDSDTPAVPWLKLCEASTGLDSHCSHLPTTTIEKFDWNQSDKFVKLYLDVPGLEEADYAKVSTTFGERHISVFVAGVGSHNYKFIIQELSGAIDVNESKFRLKQERVVLFLMKKQQTRWTDLTAKATASRKESVDCLLNKMRVVFNEFLGLTALVENLPEELRSRMLMESGCLVVDDTAHTAQVLELVQADSPEPPKLVLFRMRLSQPFPNEDFEKALKALADLECYITLQNDQFEHSSDVEEDDQFVRLLVDKPCTLVSFCGRLSREYFSFLPAALLELKLFISSAEELNALVETIITVDTLHVRVKTDMDLKDVKKFSKRVLLTPLCLVFYGIQDGNVEWLLDCIRKMLPLSNMQNMNPLTAFAWSLELLACHLTCAAHKRLFSQLPMDPTTVTIHDTTGDPEIANLAIVYAERFCKFDLRPTTPSSAVSKQ